MPKEKRLFNLSTCGTVLDTRDIYSLKKLALQRHQTASALLRELAIGLLKQEGFEVHTGQRQA